MSKHTIMSREIGGIIFAMQSMCIIMMLQSVLQPSCCPWTMISRWKSNSTYVAVVVVDQSHVEVEVVEVEVVM